MAATSLEVYKVFRPVLQNFQNNLFDIERNISINSIQAKLSKLKNSLEDTYI